MIPDIIAIHDLIDIVIAILDARDPYTYEHSYRVALYTETICKHMGLSADLVQQIHIAAHFHDIGKIGIPDKILKKLPIIPPTLTKFYPD